MLRYKFFGFKFFSPLTKIPTQTPKLFWAHINISHILLKYFPCYWAPTNISYRKPHKLPWTISQILPVISHKPSNLNSPQIILIILLPKLGRKITLAPQKAQHHLASGQNPKKAQTPQSSTTMWLIQSLTTIWLIQKSHYDVANSMSHYDVTNSKPATMRHYV